MNLILYNCLTSCSQNDVPVVVDWLYNFLEDRFEKGQDDLTSVEQDYLRVMLDYKYKMVMIKLRADDENICGKEAICELKDDSEMMNYTDGKGSVIVLEEIELDVPTQCTLTVAEELVIKHRLRRIVDKLFTGFKSIKDQLPELLKQTIVSSEAIVIMKSTSIDTDLCNCSSYLVLVNKEWLYDMLEESFEVDRDELISVEQEYLRRLLDCLYAKDDCLKEASITLHEYIPMDVETDCNNTDFTHNLQNDSDYSEQKSKVDKLENDAKQKCEIENEGSVFGTNYYRGTLIVEAPEQRTMDDFTWRCKKSITKRDI